MKNIARRILLFAICLLLWLLLTLELNYLSLALGVFICALIAFWMGDIFIDAAYSRILDPRRYFWLMCYIPTFLLKCIQANIDVAYRVLHPRMPINPGIVKVRTKLKTDFAKTMLANSITLTPGTMSVDIKGEYLYIHWIEVKAQDIEGATKRIVDWAEKYIRKICE
jgi:multicomponent Na+:H+ antiporter subunit E